MFIIVEKNSWKGATDDLLAFFISPVIEKRLSTGTDEALGVK
jgi:hypothetical protein